MSHCVTTIQVFCQYIWMLNMQYIDGHLIVFHWKLNYFRKDRKYVFGHRALSSNLITNWFIRMRQHRTVVEWNYEKASLSLLLYIAYKQNKNSYKYWKCETKLFDIFCMCKLATLMSSHHDDNCQTDKRINSWIT
jgi:hypothetical protein